MRNFLLSSLFFIILINFGCKKDSNNPATPGGNDNTSIVLGPGTKDIEIDKNLNSVQVDSSKLILNYKSNALPEIKTGDILFGKTGLGYLRKVVSVSTQGNTITVSTTNATLEDAFQKLNFDTSLTFVPTQNILAPINKQEKIYYKGQELNYVVNSGQPTMNIDKNTGTTDFEFPNMKFKINTPDNSGVFELTAEKVKVSITTELKKWSLDIENNALQKFSLIYNVKINQEFNNVSMNLKGGIDEQFPDLKNEDLFPADIPLGYLPAPIIVSFSLNIAGGIQGKFLMGTGANLVSNMTASSNYDVGAEYINGNWSAIWDKSATGNTTVNFEPIADISGDARLFIKPKIKARIFDIAGPNLFVRGFLYGEVSYVQSKAAVGLGLDGGLGFEIKALTYKIASFTWVLAEIKWPFWEKALNQPPTAPSSPSPAAGATDQSTSPTLSWSCSDPDGDALTYDVYFGTSSNPTTTISTNQSSSSISRSGLTANTTYYWKVVAKDSKGTSTTGPIWNFTTSSTVNHPPAAPSSPSPSTGATGQSTSPTLSWSCSDPDGDALTYDVYFGTSSNPTSTISTNQSSTSISRSGLAASTTYYWKVVAKDSKGASTTGTIWNFTTSSSVNHPPAAPSSPSPSTGATGQSTSPTLSWSCSDPDGDALTYDVYFGTSSNPTTTVSTNQSSTSISRSGLTANTTYYWKVVAKDSKGASTTGPIWNFTTSSTVNHPPAAPSSPSPSTGATGQSTSPTLSWSCSDPDGDALTYDVYFGTSSNPTTTVSTNQSSTSISRSGLTANTTYYWKVVAKDSKGASTTGPIWNFTTSSTVNHPPAAPSSPSPSTGATGQSTSPTLSWSCSDPDGDALTYDVYFGTSSNPTTTVSTNQSSTSISRSGLTANTTYYWKVVAKDSKGASTTGPIWNFTTSSTSGNPKFISHTATATKVTVVVAPHVYSADVTVTVQISNYQSVTEVDLIIGGTNMIYMTHQGNGVYKYSGTGVTVLKDVLAPNYEGMVTIYVGNVPQDTWEFDIL